MSHTHSTDYLVEMKFTPLAGVPTPAEAVAIAERFIQPTLEQCERLLADGTIVAGGPRLGGMELVFVMRAESAQAVEELVMSLPGWPRAQTTVAPLGRFERRAAAGRERLAKLKATLAANAGTTGNN